ncbi:hypothetical protein EV356DRAFT_152392 [Viridothelium virens]|uniref:UTP23 sensor motif region domain-containing protein n=1 Tax=Viridothelium virens TaxID=1048519 RepID=A0A6A6H8Z1_VIRVR|nr:hypothetical protein EV356DRAFT_152392 [Viridothelium virens]
MRGKRSKQYRKLLEQYGYHFGFREPYQVLFDAEILMDAHKFTMDLLKMVEGALHGRIKPMITHCTLLHLRTLPSSLSTPLLALTRSNCELRRCGHHELPEPLSTMDCFLDCIDPKIREKDDGIGTNRHRYVVATQDGEARRRLREIPGVPLLYVKRSVLVMEPMSQGSMDVQEREERRKFRAGLKGGRELKRKRDVANGGGDAAEDGTGDASQTIEPLRKKKSKGPKGPNPLSVLKPKKTRLVHNGQSQDPSRERDEPSANDGPLAHEEQPKKKRKRKHKSSKTAVGDTDVPEVSIQA